MLAVIISPLLKKGLLDERQFSIDELLRRGRRVAIQAFFWLAWDIFQMGSGTTYACRRTITFRMKATAISTTQTIRIALTGQALPCRQLAGWRQRAQL